MLKALRIAPEQILHIGDNKKADVDGVAPFGVNTLHLKQFTEGSEQRIRLESAISNIFHPTAAGVAITHQPHPRDDRRRRTAAGRCRRSARLYHAGPRAERGSTAGWTTRPRRVRAQHGGTVHAVFLMRDGHLPQLVHEARGSVGHAVEISRFTGTAAALATPGAVDRYLQREICGDLTAVAKQLLLPAAEAARLVKDNPRPGAFRQGDPGPAAHAPITQASRSFADRRSRMSARQ